MNYLLKMNSRNDLLLPAVKAIVEELIQTNFNWGHRAPQPTCRASLFVRDTQGLEQKCPLTTSIEKEHYLWLFSAGVPEYQGDLQVPCDRGRARPELPILT
jgi:hypothetical protein